MIKAVFSDLDGTLLNENGVVSEETAKTIEKLKKAGIKFFIATGRSFLAMKRYYDYLNLDTEIINYNGAVIHNSDGNKIFELTLDDAIARELINYGRENNLYFHGFSNEKWYLEDYNDTAAAYGSKSQLQENIVNFDNMPKLDFNKMMFINDPDTTKTVDSYIIEKYKNKIYKGLSSPTFLEIMNPDVSKGNAVNFLLKKYGFHPDEVIAFGDAENDLEMLLSVKYGVAMENAGDDVKSKVNYTAPKNTENGVALFLEDFLKL
jgi:Cof subfamily protein (haloacid dehalogenase superfamily)